MERVFACTIILPLCYSMRTWIVWLWNEADEIEWNKIESTNSIRSNPKYVWCIVCCVLWTMRCVRMKMRQRMYIALFHPYNIPIKSIRSKCQQFRQILPRCDSKQWFKWRTNHNKNYVEMAKCKHTAIQTNLWKVQAQFLQYLSNVDRRENKKRERERNKKCSTLNSKRFSLFAINKIYWLH